MSVPSTTVLTSLRVTPADDVEQVFLDTPANVTEQGTSAALAHGIDVWSATGSTRTDDCNVLGTLVAVMLGRPESEPSLRGPVLFLGNTAGPAPASLTPSSSNSSPPPSTAPRRRWIASRRRTRSSPRSPPTSTADPTRRTTGSGRPGKSKLPGPRTRSLTEGS